MRQALVAIALLALVLGLNAQDIGTLPEFEVASIKPSPQQAPNQAAVGIHIDGAQFRSSFFALKDYLGVAYQGG